MTPDDHLFKQLIETFNNELESLLTPITHNLKKIEHGESVNELPQMMEEISRSGRNIKVSAFSVGVDDLGRIAECIEKLYAPPHQISPELIKLTFSAVDVMRETLHNFIEKKPASANFHELLKQLDQQLKHEEKKEIPQVVEEKPIYQESNTPSVNGLEDEFVKKILETFKAELQENLIVITDGLLQLEKGTKSEQDFQNVLEEIFRVAHNIKGSARGVGASDVAEIAHHIETLFAEIQKKNINISPEIINLCLQAIDYMNEAMECYYDKTPLSFDLNSYLLQLERYKELPTLNPSPLSEPSTEKQQAPKETEKATELQTKTNEFESIRVSLQNLDRISVYMEEVQVIKIAIEEYYSKLAKINFKLDHIVQSWKKNISNLTSLSDRNKEQVDALSSTNIAELSEINNFTRQMQRELHIPVSELSILLNGLQDEVRTLRLIPVSSQLRYLPRIVRDLAQELHKKVNLEIRSNNVKIDKIILDGLKDPIVHILRNAIDHGIEDAAARQAAGKSPQGNIIIDVNQADNHIVFRISDDGAGIDTEALIRIALQKKMITQAELQMMKQEDIFDLIFRPGFSTREVATDISGRGVGLDVVRSNLLRLKGQVSLTSQLGQGTVFSLHVPLTLSTERGLIIACQDHVFAIITSSVESVLLLKKQEIVKVEGSATVLVKERPVLLCSLSTLLHLDEKIEDTKDHFSVVVIKVNEESIALLVDEIIGEKEIVLKPLQEPLTNIPCIIGATLTGSNQINFVLNSSEIIKRVLLK